MHAPTHTRRSYWRRTWKQLAKMHFNDLQSRTYTWNKTRANNLVGGEGFLPDFPQTCPKSFSLLLPTNFLRKDHQDFFVCDFQKKKGLHLFFCKRWAPFFEVKQGRAPCFPCFSRISPGFSGIMPGFLTYQNFWGCACTPWTTASCTTAWQDSLLESL